MASPSETLGSPWPPLAIRRGLAANGEFDLLVTTAGGGSRSVLLIVLPSLPFKDIVRYPQSSKRNRDVSKPSIFGRA
jgi:hypothetical protein